MNHDSTSAGVSRRAVLAGAAGAAVTAGVAGAGTAAAQSSDYLADANGYEEVVDHTGETEVRVSVGAGDGFAFDPAVIRVDPGTAVVWEWTGDGGSHDVTERDDAYASELTGEEGFEFEHTFDEEGVSLYRCTPHEGAGMKGAVLVGDGSLESGGGGSIPLVPGVGVSLGIIGVVTVAVSKWAGAGRDATRT